ncbi:MAG: T9SS type A sorting domain-containing protein [Chitinophagaceae bacterium]|nr:T9SS type A sorting domain-containing protein [Chitinophagaceae bacterium]
MILPIICNDVCELDITPATPEVCKNKPKTITASGATTYSWAPADGLDCTTCAVVTFDYDATTTYTVTGDGGDCTAEVTVVVKETPTSNFTIGACSGGAVLLTRTGTPSVGVTYKWFRNGVKLTGSASTGSTYSATISGNYKVKTTITATNCSKVSGEKTVTISCKAGDNSNFTAEAYPNPFSQSVTINMASGSTELANVRLVDLSGRTLREFTGVDTSAPFEINENLAPGVYFVRVSQGSTEKMIKIIKE